MMQMTFLRRTAPALVGVVLLAGCMELEVTNQNTPGLDIVYSDPATLESAVGTSFRVIWGVAQGARTNPLYPVLGLSVLGNELTSANTPNPMILSSEPRPALDNTDAGGWTNRKPWYDTYEAIATVTDGLRALDAGVQIGDVSTQYPNGRHTERARYFGKFIQGLGHLYIGMLFDQGFVVDETMSEDPFAHALKPSAEVLAHGIALLNESIALMQAAQATLPAGARARDTLPTEWINGQTITNLDLIKVANSYVARALVYSARTPEERAAVNWQAVLGRLDAGITVPFGQQADAAITGTTSGYVQYSQLQTDGRVNSRLVGPGDTTGAYQAWLNTPREQRQAFTVGSPDRRIHGAGGATTNGSVFGHATSQTMPTARGTYMHSNYRGVKWGTLYYNRGYIATMTPTEMNFLRAEALIRLGREAEAVPIINKTRVDDGKLPPITVAGPPAGASCVPRKDSGACGDLWDAFMYEKRMATFATEAIIPFADARGWGKLLPGTVLEFPVHGRELETLGLPIYTFGGDQPSSAPANWPLDGKP